MPYYTKCVRCGTFGPCGPVDYNRLPNLPKGWSMIVLHKDTPDGTYDPTRVVCQPCTAYFLLLLHDNMPHREP